MTVINMQKEKERLRRMLRFRRPMGSKSERHFIDQYIRPLGAKQDDAGNLIVKVGNKPRIMYSSHTDSVHNWGGMQAIEVGNGIISLAKSETSSNCLGADDAVGVWVMINMIKAKKPGLYIFHRGEERGAIGSNWLVKNTPGVVRGIKAAIAFDRRGIGDVITHQGVRTCSDDFAKSIAAQLGGAYKPSDLGMFTDTKVYRGLIGECTNLSAGYMNEHSRKEILSEVHAERLLRGMLDFDPSKLVFKRKPGEVDPADYRPWWDDPDYRYYPGHGASTHDSYRPHGSYKPKSRLYVPDDSSVVDDGEERHESGGGAYGNFEKMVRMIKSNPREIAEILNDYGLSYAEIREDVLQYGGYVPQD